MKNTESHNKLLGRASLLSVMTLVSRLLGMVRDMVCAAVFGSGYVWDAFIYAFTFPNFLRRVLGEGALSSVFIPVYMDTLNKKGREAADHLANDMMTLVMLAVGVLVVIVVGVLFAALKMFALNPKTILTIKLSIILFPYILFLAQYGMAMAVLNCRGHFLTPSLGPVVFNIMWITSAVFIAPRLGKTGEDQAIFLAFCLLVGGFVQYLIQLIPLKKFGFHVRFVVDLKDDAVKKILRLFLPATMGFGIMQVNILFDRTLAAWLGEGANSALWYSNRLIQFPIGLVPIAMGTALLPQLSEQLTAGQLDEAKRSISFSLRMVLVLVIPASVGLVAFRMPIIRMLFEHGAFGEASTARCARTLVAYSFGLFAYSGSNLLVSAFYALKDTKTPVKIASYCVLFDIIANLILMFPMKEVGLALTTSLSGILNFSLLIYLLSRKRLRLDEKEIVVTCIKSLLASVGAAWIVSLCIGGFGGLPEANFAGLVKLFLATVAGIVSYILLARLIRMSEIKDLSRFLKERLYDSGRTDQCPPT